MGIAGRQTRPVAIVGGMRIPFCKMGTNYAEQKIVDLLTAATRELVNKYDLKGIKIDDVAMGTVFDHPQVWNLAREAVLNSGLAQETPAQGTQRACATSLDATINLANKIALGQIECGIAGGAESASDTAVFFNRHFAHRLIRSSQAKSMQDRLKVWKGMTLSELKPQTPPITEKSTGKTMGQHCEMMVKDWNISQKEQDEIAYASHINAARAWEEGFYSDLVATYMGASKDNTVRADTTMERLAKLKPVFDRSEQGTVTAGNSSPLTDGAAAVLLCSEDWAKKHNLPVLAYLTEYETSAVNMHEEGLLMAPAYAMARMLQRAKLGFSDIDFFEIHEAFAGQVACTLKAWEDENYCKNKLKLDQALGKIDRSKLNSKGGSVAIGHPFGATGARLVASLSKMLNQKGSGKGVISICAGGGMGTVAIIEK